MDALSTNLQPTISTKQPQIHLRLYIVSEFIVVTSGLVAFSQGLISSKLDIFFKPICSLTVL